MDASPESPDPAELLAMMPFAAALGVELVLAGATEVVGVLAWTPGRCTAGGVLHGGAIMALADSVGGVCAFLNLPAGAGTSTIGSTTNFFRAVRGGLLRAVARPLHTGGRTIVVQTDLTGEHDGRAVRVAQVTQTQAVLSAGSR
ncbi:MAG TPA: PaaI family thioesterase [Mycobacteriales bacterium]|nr:PaaI family thioesterase [Mycobacteriales bacterium]